MQSAATHSEVGFQGARDASRRPIELRLALGGLLLFAALLPVHVWVRVPGLGAAAAVSPADLALAVSLPAYAVALLRRTARLHLGSFGVAVFAYLLCVLVSVAASESIGRSVVRSATILACATAALLAANLVDSEATLRKVALAWIFGAAFTVVLGLATIALFYVGAAPALVTTLTSDFGSLPVTILVSPLCLLASPIRCATT